LIPKNNQKSAKKNLPRAVFAAFLAKIMQDSLHLDAQDSRLVFRQKSVPERLHIAPGSIQPLNAPPAAAADASLVS
jgi:hypothetical protein